MTNMPFFTIFRGHVLPSVICLAFALGFFWLFPRVVLLSVNLITAERFWTVARLIFRTVMEHDHLIQPTYLRFTILLCCLRAVASSIVLHICFSNAVSADSVFDWDTFDLSDWFPYLLTVWIAFVQTFIWWPDFEYHARSYGNGRANANQTFLAAYADALEEGNSAKIGSLTRPHRLIMFPETCQFDAKKHERSGDWEQLNLLCRMTIPAHCKNIEGYLVKNVCRVRKRASDGTDSEDSFHYFVHHFTENVQNPIVLFCVYFFPHLARCFRAGFTKEIDSGLRLIGRRARSFILKYRSEDCLKEELLNELEVLDVHKYLPGTTAEYGR